MNDTEFDNCMKDEKKERKKKEHLVVKIKGEFSCQQFIHKNAASRISPGFELWFLILNFIYKSNVCQMNKNRTNVKAEEKLEAKSRRKKWVTFEKLCITTKSRN